MTIPPAPGTALRPPRGPRAFLGRPGARPANLRRLTKESSLQQLPGDDQLLHFAGALVDAQRTDVPVEAFDGVAASHARAAPQLHGGVDDALRALGGGELGHRGLACHGVSLVA